MGNDFLAVATGIHQGIGKDWHSRKFALIINDASQINDCGCLPTRINSDGAKGVADDVANEIGLWLAILPLVSMLVFSRLNCCPN